MVKIGQKPGRYRLALNLYFDEINQDVGGLPEAEALLIIYRKSDNKKVNSLYIPGISGQPVKYANQACSKIRQLKTTWYRYEKVVDWNPEDYGDPNGYYMSWQYCCRNGVINNIQDPIRAGQTFYLEFPAMIQNGKDFIDSVPVFDQIDGEYLCLNEPFRFSFDAKDADDDELRYSMTTPLDRLDLNLGVGSKNGVNIQWVSGFSANNAIPGNPPLTINRQTGELTVTASQVGLFVFTVVVEEYRNGKQIGQVRRDYQLFVVDCPPTIPPDPTVTINNQPGTEVQVCEGKTVELKATSNIGWEYQWKKNGKNLAGATTPTLQVIESGVYQLTTSLKAQCSKNRRSSDVKVTVSKSSFTLKSKDPLRICGESGRVRLEALSGDSLTYQWYVDEKPLSENSSLLIANQPGRYWAVIRNVAQGCSSFSDTVLIKPSALPVATITPQRTTTAICSGDSLRLFGTNQHNYQYQWHFDGVPLAGATTNSITAQQVGQYTLTVTDTSSCQLTTPAYKLAIAPSITVLMDSIPPFCGINHAPITIKGYPAGGVFSGAGIKGDLYDPRLAGVGNHELRYTVNSPFACQNGSVSQTVIIRSAPTLNLGPDIELGRGSSKQLQSGLKGNYMYQWYPPVGLSNSQVSDPEVSPNQTTTYTLIVTDQYGCSAEDSILVRVYERIWIPDAFSPNGDGINDHWELRGIESYPEAVVTIFNRWGEVVFFSKQYKQPFDGQFHGTPLPEGLYIYQIKLSPTQTLLSGSLLLVN